MEYENYTFLGYLPAKCKHFVLNCKFVELEGDDFSTPSFIWQHNKTKDFMRAPHGKHATNHPEFRIPLKIEQALIAMIGDSLLIENGNTLLIPYEGYLLSVNDDYSFWIFSAENVSALTIGVIITDSTTGEFVICTDEYCNLKWTFIRGKTTYEPGYICNGVIYPQGMEIFKTGKYVIIHDIGKTKCPNCEYVVKYRCVPADQFYLTLPDIKSLGLIDTEKLFEISDCECNCKYTLSTVIISYTNGQHEHYIADTLWWPSGYNIKPFAYTVDDITYLIENERVIGTMRKFNFAPTDQEYWISDDANLYLDAYEVDNFGVVFEITHDNDEDDQLGFNLTKNYSITLNRNQVAIYRPGELMCEPVYAIAFCNTYRDILPDYSIYTINGEKLDLTYARCIKSINASTPKEEKEYNGIFYEQSGSNWIYFFTHELLPGTIIVEDSNPRIATYQNFKQVKNVKPALH